MVDNGNSEQNSNLTPQQKEEVTKLKQLLKEDLNLEYDEFVSSRYDAVDDIFILRFFRATMADKSGKKLFDSKACFKRLKDSIDFRREHETKAKEIVGTVTNSKDLDTKQTKQDSDLASMFEKYLRIKPNYRFHDNNVSSSLVVIERFGIFGSKVNPKTFTLDQWDLFTFILLDTIERELFAVHQQNMEKDETSDFKGFIGIIDLKGVSSGVVSPKRLKFITHLNDITGAHFPELVQNYYFINCPFQFMLNGLLKVIKQFLDQVTYEKFKFLSKAKQLGQYVDSTLLSKEFGGDSVDEVPLSEV